MYNKTYMKEMNKIYLLDATLREGHQTLYQKNISVISKDYLTCIQQMGIKNVEIRNPYSNIESMEDYLALIKEFPGILFETHMYLNKRNVESFTKDKNIKRVSTFIPYPISDDSMDLLDVFLVQNPDKLFRVSVEKIARLNRKDMKKVSLLFRKHSNLQRLGLSDTNGELDGTKLISIIKRIKRYRGFQGKDLELHLHNDRGLALANALSAINFFNKKKQNLYISSSMNGLAERNGLPSLGGLIANMLFINMDNGYDFSHYSKLVDLFDKNNIYFDSDPCGKNTFTHVAESHLSKVISANDYNLFNPKEIGLSHDFIFNKKTPIDIISCFLLGNNIKISNKDIGKLLDKYFFKKKTTITGSSLVQIISNLKNQD